MVTDHTDTVYLHFRMIFRNTLVQNKLKDVNKIVSTFKKIVEDAELPELPRTSVTYKIIQKIIPDINWKKIAEQSLNDVNKIF